MKEVTLEVSPRGEKGKGAARRSRMAGFIPGVVYGPETEPYSIQMTEKAFRAAMRQAGSISVLFNIDVRGKMNKVLIREMQRDPVTSRIVHVDFHAISMNKPIHLTIPVKYVGMAKGVKTEGGILQTVLRELEISCLPLEIPDTVEVDVSELGIGDSLHVRDLKVANAKILSDESQTLVVVAAPTIVVVEEPTEAVVAEGEAVEGAEAAEGAEGEEKDKAKEASGKEKKEVGKEKKEDREK